MLFSVGNGYHLPVAVIADNSGYSEVALKVEKSVGRVEKVILQINLGRCKWLVSYTKPSGGQSCQEYWEVKSYFVVVVLG